MIELGQSLSKTLNSFGVVSAATGCKNPIYTKYGGKSPTGPNANQFTKVTIKGCSQRPGGNTYTDLVLKGDFIISFKYYDGASGNGYIFFGFYPETYKKYSHNCLNCNGNSYGQNSQWGTYSVPI